jgi:hypothetical protein
MSASTISRGNILKQFILQPTLTPTTVTASAAAEQNFTVIGLLLGDVVEVNSNTAHTGPISIGNCRVSATNTLTIQFVLAGTVNTTPASGVYSIIVSRIEGTAPTADA